MLIRDIFSKSHIAIIGNGGSCSTAEHMACDLRSKGLNVEALTNSSIITQIGNDMGFEHIFMEQLKKKHFDCLIVITASGNSPNIIRALKYAREEKIFTIGLLGFDGGKAKVLCDKFHLIESDDYEYVEDKHLQLSHKIKKEKIIWANGCFDLLHAGHIKHLQEAGKLGYLVVSITSDKSVEKEKRNPITNQIERAKIISAIEGVDEVHIVDRHADFLKVLKPDIYTKGGDYNIDTINQEERKIVEEYGGEIRFIGFIPNLSTSEIINKIKGVK